MNLSEKQLAELWKTVTQWAIPALSKLMGVLFLFWVAFKVANAASRATKVSLDKAKIDETLAKFASKMVRYLILIMAGVGCLGSFGIQTASFAAVLGAAGFAVGLAFQGTLSNFASGVMLLVFRPFNVGDIINAGGVTGKVFEIELFTTAIDTPDMRRIIVPNSSIFGSTIENVTFHKVRRFSVDVGIDYSADVDVTRKVLEAAVASVDCVETTPESAVILTGLGASSVDWTVRAWATNDNFWAAKEALTRAIKVECDKADIGIPYTTVDVNLTAVPADGGLKLITTAEG